MLSTAAASGTPVDSRTVDTQRALLLGTAVVTALWLEGGSSEQLFNWDMLRLGLFGLLLLLTGPTGFALAAALFYAVANLLFLAFLRHQPAAGNAAAVL